MEVNTNPELYTWVLGQLREQMSAPKPSPHATQFIYCLTKTYYDAVDPLPPTDREMLLFSVGFGVERVMLTGAKVEPLQQDGIWVSPDFAWGIPGVPMATGFGELKTTRVKPPKQGELGTFSEGWPKQIMCYCKALGVTSMGLAVVHIIPPDMKTWDLVFTPQEIEDNWAWILNRHEEYKSWLLKVEPPTPFAFNMDWECNYGCRYKHLCDVEAIRGRQG